MKSYGIRTFILRFLFRNDVVDFSLAIEVVF